MKESYLTINNIDDGPKALDIVKMILDQNYNIMGEKYRDVIVKNLKKERAETKNAEELAGINNFELDCIDQAKKVESWKRKNGCSGGITVSTLLHGKQMFNDEELLYLNRLAFMLFTEHGSNLKFKTFVDGLKTL